VLVISRRCDEKVVFPGLGITVQVLGSKGRVVRLGIDAPPDVKIFRSELIGPEIEKLAQTASDARLSHSQRNRLNKLALTLHLVERLLQTGQEEKAQETLAKAVDLIETMSESDAPAPPKASRNLKTLVVEDDSNERELLAGVLGMNGCQADTASDGQDALEYLASHDRPDFVLLDLCMPRCDGRETLARIRNNPLFRDLKVFAVSGSSPKDLGIDIGPSGFDAWFQKPLNPSKLWRAIQEQFIPN